MRILPALSHFPCQPCRVRLKSAYAAVALCAVGGVKKLSSKEAEATRLRHMRMQDAAAAEARVAQEKISDLQVCLAQESCAVQKDYSQMAGFLLLGGDTTSLVVTFLGASIAFGRPLSSSFAPPPVRAFKVQARKGRCGSKRV